MHHLTIYNDSLRDLTMIYVQDNVLHSLGHHNIHHQRDIVDHTIPPMQNRTLSTPSRLVRHPTYTAFVVNVDADATRRHLPHHHRRHHQLDVGDVGHHRRRTRDVRRYANRYVSCRHSVAVGGTTTIVYLVVTKEEGHFVNRREALAWAMTMGTVMWRE